MKRRRPVVRINRPRAVDATEAPPRRQRLMRIGLLGGSFNPAHYGHLGITLQALKRLRLDRVWWLVSPQNPLKPAADMADFEARLASARAIAGRHPRIRVSDLEQRLGTRFTVDTLRWLRRHSRARYVWLIGADNLLQMPKWYRWRSLVRMVPIAVFDREPYCYRALAGPVARAYARRRLRGRAIARLAETRPPAWVYLRLRRYRVSSTEIRQRSSHRQAAREEDAP